MKAAFKTDGKTTTQSALSSKSCGMSSGTSRISFNTVPLFLKRSSSFSRSAAEAEEERMGRTTSNMLIRCVIGFFMTFLLARLRTTDEILLWLPPDSRETGICQRSSRLDFSTLENKHLVCQIGSVEISKRKQEVTAPTLTLPSRTCPHFDREVVSPTLREQSQSMGTGTRSGR